jgi:hypothetical protein
MNDFIVKAIAFVKHPVTSFASLLVGLGAIGTFATALGQTCSQLSRIHGVPAHLASQLDSLGVVALAISSAALILCANAHSLGSLGTPPPSGVTVVLPLAPSGDLPQSSPLIIIDQQKAA